MNLQLMTQKLIEHGYTQEGIADALKNSGVRCTQPTVSRILRGTDPSYSVGDAIRKLYFQVFDTSRVA